MVKTLIVIFLLIGADQLTKIWAVNALATQDIRIWPNIFHFTYVENRGAAFGVLQNKQLFFIITTIIIIGVMFFYLKKIQPTLTGQWLKVAFTLIISGAIGNLIDRIVLGYVRDFLYAAFIHFPVFNVADILVVVGVGILMLVIFIGDMENAME